MGITDIYSLRERRRKGAPEIFQYKEIPKVLRVQLVHIIESTFGMPHREGYIPNVEAIAGKYQRIHQMLCREYGVFSLAPNQSGDTIYPNHSQYRIAIDPHDDLVTYLVDYAKVPHVLDILELFLVAIDHRQRKDGRWFVGVPDCDDIIEEVNSRLREHAVGFEYVDGLVIRVDSKLVHEQVTKPALLLLTASKYEGANEEFHKAHEHYRHGRHKECLVDCLKAFESTMKSICEARGWAYHSGDTASRLIKVCIDNDLFPSFLQSQLDGVRALLQSGVPTLRNKAGGHGQRSQVTPVPRSLAEYMLHLTASNIVFLAEAEKNLP